MTADQYRILVLRRCATYGHSWGPVMAVGTRACLRCHVVKHVAA